LSLPISGFTAVPNPMMLSFLASQGFAIMYYGGAGWQFGKRKVSGMSNEEVNAMSPHDFMLKLNGELKTMVPTMQQGMADMTPLIKTTVVQFGEYIREAIKAFPQAVAAAVGSSGEFSNIPTTDSLSGGTGGTLPPQMASFLHYFKTLSDNTKANVDPQTLFNQYLDRKDTSGQTIREFEANKKAKVVADARARVERSNQLKRIGKLKSPSVAIAPIFGNKKGAGQSQIMERNRLIKQIARNALDMKNAASNRSSKFYRGNIIILKKELVNVQQRLVNLLDRYRF